MILFTVLTIILIVMAVLAAIILSIGGGVFMVIFADVIVCMLFIIFIMKRLFFKK